MFEWCQADAEVAAPKSFRILAEWPPALRQFAAQTHPTHPRTLADRLVTPNFSSLVRVVLACKNNQNYQSQIPKRSIFMMQAFGCTHDLFL